ncbi:MAG: hypothetical protein K8S23_09410 [Candidatus Cloacimonetes bacterium]|nr:hypothetical protein [Candidatus Cloacimonadota bacterium]
MKNGILVILLVLVSAIYADVMFYDDFNRANGEVGNDWQFNTPAHLTNSSIINGVYNTDLTSTGNTYHDFTSQTSGKVYVEYDWKLITNDWTACVYPVSELIFIRVDWLGNITYDDNSSFTSPTDITQINFEQWYDVKICYDLDNDTFSFWIDNIQYVTNASANSVSSINSFYFLNINAPNFVQQIDEFIVYNDEIPDIPQNLTATENVDDITLNWDAVPNPLLVNYKIFRDTSSNPTTEIAEVGPDITTYIDVVRALPNTDYYYRIKSVGINELESDYSDEVGVVQLKPDISVDPTEIEIQLNTNSNIQTEYFDINNSGNGQLNYFVQGDDTLGNFGSCLDFDGVNDRVVWPDGTFETVFNSGSYTFSIWVFKDGDATGYDAILSHTSSTSNNDFSVTNDEKIRVYCQAYDWEIVTDESINLNQWTFIAFSYNDSTEDMSIYIDGIFSKSGHIGHFSNPNSNWELGDESLSSYNRNWHGKFDNISIWNAALSQTDIQNSMYTELFGNEPNLYGYWNFNEDSGDILNDCTTNGNNGTLTNMNLSTCWIDSDLPKSILSFNPYSGTILAGRFSQQIEMITDGTNLTDGVYNVNAVITSNAIAPDDNLEIPVTVKVDYNPPLAVQNVVFTSSTPDEIQIDWDSNAISDSVYYYNVYRRSNDEPSYSLIGNSSTTTYVDYAFTGLDTTYFWYKVAGMDWVNNEGTHSSPCQANLNRFKAPQNLQITMENNNRSVKLVWDSVTETISGLPGTPTCYVVYYNQIDPETDENFYFLATSTDTTYTHQNVGLFIETDHMFYTVTAYGGSMRAFNYFTENDVTFKFGELEKMIYDFSKNNANIQHKEKISRIKK